MSKVDDYGLRGLVGDSAKALSAAESKDRFEKTQKALADWRAKGGEGTLGDFYDWLLQRGGK